MLSKKLGATDAEIHLVGMAGQLEGVEAWEEAGLEKLLRAYVEQRELPAGKLFRLVRVAVVGGEVAPGLFETLAAIGKQQVLQRMESSIDTLRSS